MKKKLKKIVYIINHTSFFVSHRFELAKYANKNSYQIYLITGKAGSKKMEKFSNKIIKKSKIKFFRANFSPSSINIFSEISSFYQIIKFCRKIKPDIIHTASPKANLIGGLVGKIINVPSLVISISGEGHLFTKKNIINNILSFVYKLIQKYIFSHQNKTIILQNTEDFKKFSKLDNYTNCSLVPGSGVNLNKYKSISPHQTNKNILFVGRILIDKGIIEFIEAAKYIKKKFPDWNFIVVGPKDYKNPSKIKDKILDKWISDRIIIWKDYNANMSKYYENSAIVCLPSHKEGFSKVILEAGASARPVVVSDIPGCKEAMLPKISGELFKKKDSKQLIKKLILLINNPKLRVKYGIYGRKLVKEKFEINKINKKILNIYNSLYKKCTTKKN